MKTKTIIKWKCSCGQQGETEEGCWVRCDGKDCKTCFHVEEVYLKVVPEKEH